MQKLRREVSWCAPFGSPKLSQFPSLKKRLRVRVLMLWTCQRCGRRFRLPRFGGWQHQQTGRSLSTQLVHDWCAGRDPLCQNPRDQASAMARGAVGTATDKGRCHANKIARMAWAMMTKGEPYREPIALAA